MIWITAIHIWLIENGAFIQFDLIEKQTLDMQYP